MNSLQAEERRIRASELDYSQKLFHSSKAWLSSEPAPRTPPGDISVTTPGVQLPLFAVEEAAPCEECGGRGYDVGSIVPEGEPCPTCHGSGIEYTTRMIPMKPVQSTPERKREEVA